MRGNSESPIPLQALESCTICISLSSEDMFGKHLGAVPRPKSVQFPNMFIITINSYECNYEKVISSLVIELLQTYLSVVVLVLT